jgi:hypothetical protein
MIVQIDRLRRHKHLWTLIPKRHVILKLPNKPVSLPIRMNPFTIPLPTLKTTNIPTAPRKRQITQTILFPTPILAEIFLAPVNLIPSYTVFHRHLKLSRVHDRAILRHQRPPPIQLPPPKLTVVILAIRMVESFTVLEVF